MYPHYNVKTLNNTQNNELSIHNAANSWGRYITGGIKRRSIVRRNNAKSYNKNKDRMLESMLYVRSDMPENNTENKE
jgi:hypothetical protein